MAGNPAGPFKTTQVKFQQHIPIVFELLILAVEINESIDLSVLHVPIPEMRWNVWFSEQIHRAN